MKVLTEIQKLKLASLRKGGYEMSLDEAIELYWDNKKILGTLPAMDPAFLRFQATNDTLWSLVNLMLIEKAEPYATVPGVSLSRSVKELQEIRDLTLLTSCASVRLSERPGVINTALVCDNLDDQNLLAEYLDNNPVFKMVRFIPKVLVIEPEVK